MVKQLQLANSAFAIKRQLVLLIKAGKITLAGNARLKIYGTLKCGAGKRMKGMNRVFFTTAAEAVSKGYRPCGHCLKPQYQQWKAAQTH